MIVDLSGNDPGDSDPDEFVYAGGPLVINERIAPALAAMRNNADGFRAESRFGPEWEQDHTNVSIKGNSDVSFDGDWFGFSVLGECVYCGPFESLMILIEKGRIHHARSPEGVVYRRRVTADLMASLRDIARSG